MKIVMTLDIPEDGHIDLPVGTEVYHVGITTQRTDGAERRLRMLCALTDSPKTVKRRFLAVGRGEKVPEQFNLKLISHVWQHPACICYEVV